MLKGGSLISRSQLPYRWPPAWRQLTLHGGGWPPETSSLAGSSRCCPCAEIKNYQTVNYQNFIRIWYNRIGNNQIQNWKEPWTDVHGNQNQNLIRIRMIRITIRMVWWLCPWSEPGSESELSESEWPEVEGFSPYHSRKWRKLYFYIYFFHYCISLKCN